MTLSLAPQMSLPSHDFHFLRWNFACVVNLPVSDQTLERCWLTVSYRQYGLIRVDV